ncbi:SWIB-domain-containing protein [Phanerochaete sordida]|uniref:SWIB-domain-containing protein n=1 Tax=Phanerochaete sordida TaxID=48140 RepID=A0A9P3LE98_9APHY|nr:SWIB-domain-containing protein [Phanerochaete sordida]
MPLDISKYAAQIRDILTAPGVDLGTISAKRVRKQLLEQNEDLTPELVKEYKDDLDALIGSVYEEVSGENGEDDDSTKRKHEDDEDEGTPAPKKGKKNSEHADAELARKLSKEINGRERGARAAAPKAKAKRGKKGAKSAATVDSDGEGNGEVQEKPKRKGGFTKEYILSEPLADLLGVKQLSRPQAVKHIWVYIKEKDLQNPADKREIICDEKMKKIFNVDKIGMFRMNQMLGQHLQEPAPVPTEAA